MQLACMRPVRIAGLVVENEGAVPSISSVRYLLIGRLAAVFAGLASIGTASAGREGEGYSALYYNEAGEEVGGGYDGGDGRYTSWGVRTERYARRTWIGD